MLHPRFQGPKSLRGSQADSYVDWAALEAACEAFYAQVNAARIG